MLHNRASFCRIQVTLALKSPVAFPCVNQFMDFDILIVGGGLAGASLACALRGSRLRLALLDRAAPVVSPGWDARIYAVSPASTAFLQQCGAWQHLDPAR